MTSDFATQSDWQTQNHVHTPQPATATTPTWNIPIMVQGSSRSRTNVRSLRRHATRQYLGEVRTLHIVRTLVQKDTLIAYSRRYIAVRRHKTHACELTKYSSTNFAAYMQQSIQYRGITTKSHEFRVCKEKGMCPDNGPKSVKLTCSPHELRAQASHGRAVSIVVHVF